MKRRTLQIAAVLCALAVAGTPLLADGPVLKVGKANKYRLYMPVAGDLAAPPQTGLNVEIPVFARPGTEMRSEPGDVSRSPASAPGEALTPAVGESFEGPSDDDNADILGFRIVPPDVNGDIGYDENGNQIYVSYINLIWSIYDLPGGVERAGFPRAGNTFWTGFGGECETGNDGDPVVLYDDAAGRWVYTQFGTGTGVQCVAVSVDSNPEGPYHQYEFTVAPGGFGDYPKMGVWAQQDAAANPSGNPNQSAYTLTTRNFPFSGADFMQSIVLERDAMLVGQMVPLPSIVQFGHQCVTGDCVEGQLPPHQAGPPPPMGTCPTFFTLIDDGYDDNPPPNQDGVRLHKLCVDWSVPTGVLTETRANSSVDFDRNLGNGFSDCIGPIPGGGEVLDCLALFTMFRAQYRYFDGSDGKGQHGSVVLNTTADADGSDRAGIFWGELRSDPDGDDGWAFNQDGLYDPDDGADRWMGSIAQDGERNIALGFSIVRSGGAGDILPSVHYTARQNGDTSGTMGNEEICHTGTGVQTASANRWGDYSSMSVDPEDDCTFWYHQEYYETTGAFDWTTRVCSFKFADCGQPDCVLTAQTARRARRGRPLRVDMSIQHNRSQSVTVPFGLSVQDLAGNEVVSKSTPPFTLVFGETLDATDYIHLPRNMAPGFYNLIVTMDEMRGGRQVASHQFRVR